jgi:hypothetical protein
MQEKKEEPNVLIVGCGHKAHGFHKNCCTIDIDKNMGPDIIGDFNTANFKQKFDVIIGENLPLDVYSQFKENNEGHFENVIFDKNFFSKVFELLKPSGLLILTVAFEEKQHLPFFILKNQKTFGVKSFRFFCDHPQIHHIKQMPCMLVASKDSRRDFSKKSSEILEKISPTLEYMVGKENIDMVKQNINSEFASGFYKDTIESSSGFGQKIFNYDVYWENWAKNRFIETYKSVCHFSVFGSLGRSSFGEKVFKETVELKAIMSYMNQSNGAAKKAARKLGWI